MGMKFQKNRELKRLYIKITGSYFKKRVARGLPRQHYLMVTGWLGIGAVNGNQMGSQVVKVRFLVN